MPHRVGTVIARRYRVDTVLAVGAAGTVYKAYRKDMDRVVALKVLGGKEEALLERFRREIKATAKLQHPNIVSIFEAGTTDDGMVFYAMEYLAGERLRDLLLREERLPADRMQAIFQQIAAALGAAHSFNIVHRNLNPDDIMVGQQAGNPDFVTILDFGVASIQDSEAASELTVRGEILAQPEYFAPESLSEGEIGPAADIYAAGCIAYECLTGKPPFHSKPRMRAIWMHVREPVPDFSEDIVASTPEALRDLIMWCLEKDPTKRPRDGRALEPRLAGLDMSLPEDAGTSTNPGLPFAPPDTVAEMPEAQPPRSRSDGDRLRIPTVGESAAPPPRERRLTPFVSTVAVRPNSMRPLCRAEIQAGGRTCTFLVRGATYDSLTGSALSGGMPLQPGSKLVVAVPVDRRATSYLRVAVVVTQATGTPPELVTQITAFDKCEPEYHALVDRWDAER